MALRCRCLRTATGQAFVLGVIFFFIFLSAQILQSYACQLYGDELASNLMVTVYMSFTVASFVAPAITNLLGSRLTLFLGALSYLSIPFASLLLALFHADWCDTVIILFGVVAGSGGSLLWTAQGRIMLELSTDGRDAGRIFAIFYSLYNLAAISGGLTTFLYFSRQTEDAPVVLYALYIGLVLAGAAVCGLVAPVQGAPAVSTTDPGTIQAAPGSGGAASWQGEAVATLRLFRSRRMLRLAPIFWFCGYCVPYQTNTFANRFFDAPTLGLELIVFFVAGVVGGAPTPRAPRA